MPDHARISIVTPAYNSAEYLAATLDSVLSQAYPALEYVVIDGGSTDGTPAIIERYQDRLAYWHSQPDSGMYDALQQGFERTTGEIMAYLNSDDLYFPHTLRTVNAIFRDLPEVMWITSLRPVVWNGAGAPVDVMVLPGFSQTAFLNGEYLGRGASAVYIQQESTFWRRSLWEKAGGTLNTALKLAGDFALWAQFFQHAPLIGVRTMLGGFRVRPGQLSAVAAERYAAEARSVFEQAGGRRLRWLKQRARQLAPCVPSRLRKPASWLGITHPVQNATYDLKAQRWTLRRDYI